MWPPIVEMDFGMGLSSIIVSVVLGLVGFNLLFRVCKRKVYYVKVRDFTKGHSWKSIEDTQEVNNIAFLKLLKQM